MKDHPLAVVRVVDRPESEADQGFPLPAEGDIRENPVFPEKFVPVGESAQVRIAVPGMISRFPHDIGRGYRPAVESGKDAQIKPPALLRLGNMGDPRISFGIGAPGGEGQVVFLPVALFHSYNIAWKHLTGRRLFLGKTWYILVLGLSMERSEKRGRRWGIRVLLLFPLFPGNLKL
jgi:hypothetical protein